MKLTTYTKTGAKSKTSTDVNEIIFNSKVNKDLLSQAIRVYLSNQRQGTSQVKTRSAVIRTKKKWFKQKGTGNARHGSRNAPIFVGGGVAHGPKGLTHWRLKLTKRLKAQALVAALSAQKQNLMVCDAIEDLNGKTKAAAQLFDKMNLTGTKILVVLAEAKENTLKSMRNLPRVIVTRAVRLNIYEVALADKIIISTAAVKTIEERLGKYLNLEKQVKKKKAEKKKKEDK